MKNFTITLEESVARWVRMRATEQETSVSRFVGELLRRNMVEEESYQVRMQYYLSQTPQPLRKSRRPYHRRQELYDRRSLLVNTNILVYSRDTSEPRRQERAMAWMTHLWTTKTGRLGFKGKNIEKP